VANVVKCRPPGNRAPRAAEVSACRHWLTAQIDAADPRVLVALGGTAVAWFLGRDARLTALRGTVRSWNGRPLVVSYHPSAALRFGPNGAPTAALREDLATVAALVGAR
jgi:DNA polymerase